MFRIRDVALGLFNEDLNKYSVNAIKLHETVSSLPSVSNDLDGVRDKLATLKVNAFILGILCFLFSFHYHSF